MVDGSENQTKLNQSIWSENDVTWGQLLSCVKLVCNQSFSSLRPVAKEELKSPVCRAGGKIVDTVSFPIAIYEMQTGFELRLPCSFSTTITILDRYYIYIISLLQITMAKPVTNLYFSFHFKNFFSHFYHATHFSFSFSLVFLLVDFLSFFLSFFIHLVSLWYSRCFFSFSFLSFYKTFFLFVIL